MNGQQLWRAVRREFKKQYPNGTIHRVENTLERGMPDVVWCAGGRTGWIELKGVGDKETPLQRAFRRKWTRAGGDALVMYVVKKGCRVRYPLGSWCEDIYSDYENLAEAITAIVKRLRV